MSLMDSGMLTKEARRKHSLLFQFEDRKSTRLNSSHLVISYAVFCLKKKKHDTITLPTMRTGIPSSDPISEVFATTVSPLDIAQPTTTNSLSRASVDRMKPRTTLTHR